MAKKEFTKAFMLTREEINQLGEDLGFFLPRLHMDHKNVLRVQLFVEEILLRWQERFGWDKAAGIYLSFRLGQPILTLEVDGEASNPLAEVDEDLNVWGNALLDNIGIRSEYAYHHGKNRVRFRLPRKKKSPAVTLLLSILSAAGFSMLGQQLLPTAVWDVILSAVFQPIYDVFFRILNAASGPAVFLSVLVAIYGIGNVSNHDGAGKRLVRRLLTGAFSMATIAAVVCFVLYGKNFVDDGIKASHFSDLLTVLFKIVPNDIVTPFITSDSPALFFLALIIGAAILMSGGKMETVAQLGTQGNLLMQIIMEWIGVLMPYFIFVILVFQDAASIFGQLWRPISIFLLISVLLVAGNVLRVWQACRLQPLKLLRTLWPSFFAAFINASSTAAYGEVEHCCKRLGLSKSVSEHDVPLGMVIFMPLSGISFLVFSFQMAQYYDVNITGMWVIIVTILTTLLAIASPPIPSVNLMAYAVVFSQVGIPAQALMFALVADTIFGFFGSALNTIFLEMELLLHANEMGLLERNREQK